MTYDKTKDQMPLFEMPTVNKGKEKARKIGSKAAGNITNEKKKHPVGVKNMKGKTSARGIKKAKAVSGLVPKGDVRLTANIRQDLHLKLKIEAAHRRTTIGELIEELVERYL